MRNKMSVLVITLLALSACQSTPPEAAPPAPASASPGAVPSVEPSVEPSATPTRTAGADCAGRIAAGLSLEEQAGQLLMIGTPVASPRDLRDVVSRYHLGGVFLAGRSKRSAADLRADIAALQTGATPRLLIALDQEGGDVQTLQGADFPDIPSAQRLGGGSPAALRAEVADSTRRLAGIGVNMNLAPVADTVPAAVGTANPPIGYFHRQYGSDPAQVAAAIRTVVATTQDGGVRTTLKHFPGLGRTRFNTDTTAKAVDATATTGDPYLAPFAAGIKQGSSAVMISSASYPKLDDETIAAFSEPIITGLLRGRLGFTGMVVSDDLGAARAVRGMPTGDRAVQFVQAGGDLVLSIVPEDAGPMSAALIAAAKDDPAFAARVADATKHVLHVKQQAGLVTC